MFCKKGLMQVKKQPSIEWRQGKIAAEPGSRAG
jgi:hypothetical protein